MGRLRAECGLVEERHTATTQKLSEVEAELAEAKHQCEKTKVLEEANERLSADLAKVTQEHTEGLPEIFSSFDELAQAMKKSNCCIAKAAAKEFGSVDAFEVESKKDIREMARNCIQVLAGLLNTLENTKEPKATSNPLHKAVDNTKKGKGNQEAARNRDAYRKIATKKELQSKKSNTEKEVKDASGHIERTKKDPKPVKKPSAEEYKSEQKSERKSDQKSERKSAKKRSEGSDSLNEKDQPDNFKAKGSERESDFERADDEVRAEDKKTPRRQNNIERISQIISEYESQAIKKNSPEAKQSAVSNEEQKPMSVKESSDYIEDAIMKLTSVKKEEKTPPAKVEGDFVQSAIYKLIGQDDTNEETKEFPIAAETNIVNERVDRFGREDPLDEARLKSKFITAESIIRDRPVSPERKLAHDGKKQPKGRNITPLSKSYSFMSGRDQKDVTANPSKDYTLVQLYNNYTKSTTEFFDPSLQYGGESM